jgi:hypothetical protein
VIHLVRHVGGMQRSRAQLWAAARSCDPSRAHTGTWRAGAAGATPGGLRAGPLQLTAGDPLPRPPAGAGDGGAASDCEPGAQSHAQRRCVASAPTHPDAHRQLGRQIRDQFGGCGLRPGLRPGVSGGRAGGWKRRRATSRWLEPPIRSSAELAIEHTNSTSQIIHLPMPGDDPQQRKPDITKARR